MYTAHLQQRVLKLMSLFLIPR